MNMMQGNTQGFGPTGKPQKISNTGYLQQTYQQFTPEQMDLFRRLFSQVGPESQLSKIASGSPEYFEQLEAPALKQFAGLQGNLASRFSGMGGTGARRSSGFYNTMNTAAQDLASQLQSQRLSLQQQALRDLMGYSSELLGQRPYENVFLQQQQKKPKWWESLLGIGGQAIGSAPAFFL